ncbi:hypothetical protein L6164_010916 [Bauhinia variegata]|uniref:Uncharacterized protein n=1 Tax=Bauhinia variegata TaxID=167791 RepID=A0ACB9P4U9_BAUVA|nr:hypothetical protein L6164_010916 [Bauhinia variegata]
MFSEEEKVTKKFVVIAMLVMLLLGGSHPVEGAFAIPLDPCTLPECIAECKKILQQKFLSATCSDGSEGKKLCICLG